ncbi:MAG TPA: DUF4962 domain-containing protein [Vicinamibacteria bacterium]|nr:DUF4962 domain-containing protein [Vicinamibacteria bacterium]
MSRLLVVWPLLLALGGPLFAAPSSPEAGEDIPAFSLLVSRPVRLRPDLAGVHPRVFVTAAGLEELRRRARTTHREQWQKVLGALPALAGDPPPPPGPQARRSQNNVAHAITGVSLAWAVERRQDLLAAAKKWTLAAVDYEPWGYTYSKPNVDLAAGHLLYAIGWAYDLLWHELTEEERGRIRASLERHADLVYQHFTPSEKRRRFEFTQNHNFIPTAGLGVAALALMGESPRAERWAAAAYAHHHRANQLLSPDGYYYEGIEYWIFSAPWLVHFADAWEHATGESLWELGPYRNWKLYIAHVLLPNGQDAFDFGDAWEGPLTRERRGEEIGRLYPGGPLQSNANLLYRVAARLRDPETQAVADRCRALGHTSLEEHWSLLWRDASLEAAPMDRLPTWHRFPDSGVVFHRTSWGADALAFAFKAGPPEGHRAARLLAHVPEWRQSTGHAHPDAGSFIVWTDGRLVVGDTGYAGRPQARHHNTVVVGGFGQGLEKEHDTWEGMDRAALGGIRIEEASLSPSSVRIVAEIAAAYPPPAALSGFRREFTFDAPGRFRVRDRIGTAEDRRLEWFLHADRPFQVEGRSFRDASSATVLQGRVTLPWPARLRTGPTVLTAPGQPGSIEQGREDQRGYELVIEPPTASRTAEFDVSFDVKSR